MKGTVKAFSKPGETKTGKPKRGVLITSAENGQEYWCNTSSAMQFFDTVQIGNQVELDASDFHGSLWFRNWGILPSGPNPHVAPAGSQPAQRPQQAPMGDVGGQPIPPVSAYETPPSSMTDKNMEIWCQSILKAWIGPSDEAGAVLAKIQAVYGMYPERQSREPGSDDDLSPGIPDPEFDQSAPY